MKDLLAAAGAPKDSNLQITSMEKSGNYRLMTLPAAYTRAEQTLLVL